MSRKRIAVIPGDGIGKEVMPEGIRVMEAAAAKSGIDLAFDHFDFSSWDYCEKHGKYLEESGMLAKRRHRQVRSELETLILHIVMKALQANVAEEEWQTLVDQAVPKQCAMSH